MGTILFSSGTSGNKPKGILYSNKDLENLRKNTEFLDYDLDGIGYNTFPPYPHLGFVMADMFKEKFKQPVISTGILPIEKYRMLIKEMPPVMIAGLGNFLVTLTQEYPEIWKTLKTVILGATPMTDVLRRYFEERGVQIYSTYAFTEAKMVFFTCSDLDCGYHVFSETKRRFEVQEGELILYSPDYPKGYRTGDLGKIIGEGKCPNCGRICQRIGIKIFRKDGKIKGSCGELHFK